MKEKIKKILLGEIGAGILLIIIQLVIGVKITDSIPRTLGANILLIAGILAIIDGIRKYIKR